MDVFNSRRLPLYITLTISCRRWLRHRDGGGTDLHLLDAGLSLIQAIALSHNILRSLGRGGKWQPTWSWWFSWGWRRRRPPCSGLLSGRWCRSGYLSGDCCQSCSGCWDRVLVLRSLWGKTSRCGWYHRNLGRARCKASLVLLNTGGWCGIRCWKWEYMESFLMLVGWLYLNLLSYQLHQLLCGRYKWNIEQHNIINTWYTCLSTFNWGCVNQTWCGVFKWCVCRRRSKKRLTKSCFRHWANYEAAACWMYNLCCYARWHTC